MQTQCHWNTNRDLHTPYETVSFQMTLSDLEWLSKIFNDTKRRTVPLRQLSFFFTKLLTSGDKRVFMLKENTSSTACELTMLILSISVTFTVLRQLWSRSDTPCSKILHVYSPLPYAKFWASLGVPSSRSRSRRKTALPEGTLLTFEYHIEKS